MPASVLPVPAGISNKYKVYSSIIDYSIGKST